MKQCTLFYEEITFPLFCLASSVVHQVKKIPIAEALYYKGTGLGTVLAFMMSVTTLSIPSLTMLSRVIKPKLMVTFLGLCIVGMCISGYVFNFLQPLF